MSRYVRGFVVCAVVGAGSLLGGSPSALAQFGPGGAINPEKDCQTILRCRFRRGGVYRGCISAYSCRQCRFVRARCTQRGRRRVCRRLVCGW